MPFGKKTVTDDKGNLRTVDFDAIYQTVFVPAIRAVTLPAPETGALEPRRTDQDFFTGDISQEMFEYLEYSRIALTDITGLNANVFYELGVRHRAREAGTAIFRQLNANIPFDINQIKAFPYEYEPDDRAQQSRQLITQVLSESLKQNRLDSPAQKALKVQRENRSFIESDLRAAENALRVGDRNSAIQAYERAAKGDPGNNLLHQRLGLLYKDQGKWPEAVAEFKQAIQSNHDYAEGYRELGIAYNKLYHKTHEQPDGIEELTRATELNPDDFDAYASLGGALKRAGRLQESLTAYNHAVQVSRGHPYPLLNAIRLNAQVNGALNISEETSAWMSRAERLRRAQVATEPPYDSPWSFFDLAEICLYEKKKTEFLECAQKGAEHATDAWQIRTFLQSLEALQGMKLDLPGLGEGISSLQREINLLEGLNSTLLQTTVPPALHDPKQRASWQLPTSDDEPGSYMVELNLLYSGGVQEAAKAFETMYRELLGEDVFKSRPPRPITKTYYHCEISANEWKALVAKDQQDPDPHKHVIYKIWPDFPVQPLIDRSVATVKADAARQSYSATGEDICWAVIDSGIDQSHRHFKRYHTVDDASVVGLHRDFTLNNPQPGPAGSNTALMDGFGHGTHVAGIIAGGLEPDLAPDQDFAVFQNSYDSDAFGENRRVSVKRRKTESRFLHGVAPQCKLVSLKVLDENGSGRTSNIIRALQYVREEVNGDPKFLRIHGVNLSLGYEFDAEMFACGQSPLCVEVDRLVKSGVVVVVAAGNTGYAQIQTMQRSTKIRISSTINDPGNSLLAITVGATHRDSPHTYGVSYFSSAGPTGDGRLKPDLVAPGERITSCAAGKKRVRLEQQDKTLSVEMAAYIDDNGTSMAAPHVSGAIAAFFSIRREFLQRPEDVKRIFMKSATPLGREKYFEGSGLVDLMRAIQSV